MKSTLVFAALAEGLCAIIQAEPLVCTGRPDELCIFPHSLCISDFICTGTPTSTNDGCSAEFAVEEILWGAATSTNVTMRYQVQPDDRYKFKVGERYLVCAFTNDWWSVGRDDYFFYTEYTLSKCVMETNRPPNNAVFTDYVVLDNRRSAIPFKYINYGGTNYWDAVRTFATNIIDIAKHEGDDDKVRNAVISILNDPQKCGSFPLPLIRQMLLYKALFMTVECDKNLRPDNP